MVCTIIRRYNDYENLVQFFVIMMIKVFSIPCHENELSRIITSNKRAERLLCILKRTCIHEFHKQNLNSIINTY